MYKKSSNPIIEELTKSHRERRVNLSSLSVIKLDGLRKCVWCAEKTLRHGNQKYCSKECSNSAMAWANPQKEEGLFFLLVKQDFKCNVCQHDWAPLVQQIKNGLNRHMGIADVPFRDEYDWGLMKRLKSKCPQETSPEVDHILAISKGGTALGLDNHQAICYSCHKAKTKIDNSGPRKKKE